MIKYGAIGCGLCLAWAAGAMGAPVDTKGVADFKYRWDFDLVDDGVGINDNLDLYNNATGAAGADGVNDWTANHNGGSIVVSSGTMILTNAANTNQLWGALAAGSPITGITNDTGFTIEYRVKVAPNFSDLNGPALDIATGTSGGTVAFEYTDATQQTLAIHWALTAANNTLIQTTVPAADFFTVRIAATPNAATTGGLDYTLYVNDTLIAELGRAWAGSTRRLLLGDFGGGDRGITTVDSVAYTAGAFAPVPEPASLSLLAVSAGMMFGRRRET